MEFSPASRPVAIVDDNPDDLFFFKRCLAKANATPPLVVAEDGEQAVTLLQQPPAPLVVFLDLKLPRLSGFNVLQWIRGQRTLDAVPVIVLSSSAEPRDVMRAYALGAQGYLVKHPLPTDIAAVLAAVSAVRQPEDLARLKLPGLERPR